MSLNRFERRIVAKLLFDLVSKFQGEEDYFARRYTVSKGIGFLFLYYSPNKSQNEVDELIHMTASIYAYKRNNEEDEIIILAATRELKQWKYGLFYPKKLNDEEISQIEKTIDSYEWFKSEEKIIVDEKEYPL